MNSYEEALASVKNSIHKLCKEFSGILDKDASITIEDLLQECYIACWKAYSTYDKDKSNFNTYFSHVAHNHLIDVYRKTERDGLDINVDLSNVEGLEARDLIAEYENKQALSLALYIALTDRQVGIAKMYYGVDTEKRNMREIALGLGVSKQYVQQQLNKVRNNQQLQELLS